MKTIENKLMDIGLEIIELEMYENTEYQIAELEDEWGRLYDSQ